MERLLEVFSNYVAENDHMDVAYSDRSGYVRLIIAEDADYVFFPLKNFDNMLNMFFYDILCDEVDSARALNRNLPNADVNYPAIFLRLSVYVLKLGDDRDYAMGLLKRFIRKRKNHNKLP